MLNSGGVYHVYPIKYLRRKFLVKFLSIGDGMRGSYDISYDGSRSGARNMVGVPWIPEKCSPYIYIYVNIEKPAPAGSVMSHHEKCSGHSKHLLERLHGSGRAFGRKAEGQTDVQVATSLAALHRGTYGQTLGFHIGVSYFWGQNIRINMVISVYMVYWMFMIIHLILSIRKLIFDRTSNQLSTRAHMSYICHIYIYVSYLIEIGQCPISATSKSHSLPLEPRNATNRFQVFSGAKLRREEWQLRTAKSRGIPRHGIPQFQEAGKSHP